MPATLIATCPLCGLGFAHRLILELHAREEHVSRRPMVAEASRLGIDSDTLVSLIWETSLSSGGKTR